MAPKAVEKYSKNNNNKKLINIDKILFQKFHKFMLIV